MKKNQKGFAVLESLLILAIVGLLSFVSWFVWHSKNTTNNLLAGVTNISSSNPQFKKSIKVQPAQSASITQSPTNSSVPKKTSTSNTTNQPTPTAPIVTHPTAEDIQQAEVQALAIHSLLEAYYANYGTYTFDLNPGPLINQPGVTGASASAFTAPAGTSFSYVCSKGGPGVCAGYHLQVLKSDGTIIETLSNSFNS